MNTISKDAMEAFAAELAEPFYFAANTAAEARRAMRKRHAELVKKHFGDSTKSINSIDGRAS